MSLPVPFLSLSAREAVPRSFRFGLTVVVAGQ